jgi:hypothetical protein
MYEITGRMLRTDNKKAVVEHGLIAPNPFD